MPKPLDPPSVKKILNNGGFIAALAPILASRLAFASKLRVAVEKLAEVATAYSKMVSVLGLAHTPSNDWGGCDQAKALLRWIGLPADSVISTEEYDAFVAEVESWTAAIWAAVHDLAAGKMPT